MFPDIRHDLQFRQQRLEIEHPDISFNGFYGYCVSAPVGVCDKPLEFEGCQIT